MEKTNDKITEVLDKFALDLCSETWKSLSEKHTTPIFISCPREAEKLASLAFEQGKLAGIAFAEDKYGIKVCVMCGEKGRRLTKHHTVPRSVRKSKLEGETVDLCRPCHKKLHNAYSNKELYKKYDFWVIVKSMQVERLKSQLKEEAK